MRNLASEVYERTGVGHSGSISPPKGMSLGDFQSVVAAAENMELGGLIEIKRPMHEESQSGHEYVDLIMFTRLK